MSNIETYEQKYKNALSKARNIVNSINVGLIGKDSFEAVFPELKENGDENADEKVRKALIKLVTNHASMDLFIEYDIHLDEALSWLEKQGVQKPYFSGTMNEKGDFDDGFTRMMEKGQKPIDKEEPKFHKGEWIVFYGLTLYVKEVVKGFYRTISKGGIPNSYDWDIDNVARLWTIQDAKDGDVLAFDNDTIVIFKDLYNSTTFHSYCHIEDGLFDVSKDDMPDWWEGKGFQPATKEQRTELFQKMKEAGYEWDSEKKELKKIEQPHAWSEEDERIREELIAFLKENHETGRADETWSLSGIERWIAWLERQDRPQPKQEWSDEDEEMIVCLNNFLDELAEENGWRYVYVNSKNVELNKVRKWLKSLKPQNTWKPSEEQMETLEYYIHAPLATKHKEVLFGLYNDLKQL
jgi:hypothetical protein